MKKKNRRKIPEEGKDAILEIEIMKIVTKATTPQSGWHVYQKLVRNVSNTPDGDYLSNLMTGLEERGFLKRADSEKTLGYLFVMANKNALTG